MTDISDPNAEEEEEEEIFAYKYGADWPTALSDMAGTMLGGRPTNQTLGPVQQYKIVIAAAQYRAPTPRRAGKGKPLPPSDHEGEQETKQRKDTQKRCQRLILPKAATETPDTFIRRLDAHNNAPEALIPPLMAPEDDTLFAKRCIAVKETTEIPNALILPKNSRENVAEFEERLAIAKKSSILIFPRGAHESNAHYKARLNIAKTCRRIIMPKSAEEPERGFHMRIDAQLSNEYVIHPFDPEREDEHLYMRRLQAHKERTGLNFEPGDNKAIVNAIGEEHVHKELARQGTQKNTVAAADVMAQALDEEHAFHEKEAAEQAKQDEKAAKEAAALSEKEQEDARVAERIAEMKLKQEEAHRLAEEEANKKHSFAMEQIAINKIGFMPLKKLLTERGVPNDQVFGCSNKFALMELAKKWGDELKIQWVEE